MHKNQKKPLYIGDLSEAFDSVAIQKLKTKLYNILPESQMLSLIIKIINNKVYKVLHEGEETQHLTTQRNTAGRQYVANSLLLICKRLGRNSTKKMKIDRTQSLLTKSKLGQ